MNTNQNFNLPVTPDFTQAVQALPCWQQFPYRAVEVSFRDGSCFQLRAPDLAARAAMALSRNCGEPMAHFVKQVMPLMEEAPEILIEMAARLPWKEAMLLASSAFWKSPSVLLAKQYQRGARMTLHA